MGAIVVVGVAVEAIERWIVVEVVGVAIGVGELFGVRIVVVVVGVRTAAVGECSGAVLCSVGAGESREQV